MGSELEAEDRSLLMVEDNAAMADAVAIALRRRGYDVIHCLTVADARRCIHEKAPRYALVDLRLTDGSGLGLRRRAQSGAGLDGAARALKRRDYLPCR